VTSTIVHSSGTVVATCSGQRSTPVLGDSDSCSEESDSDEDSEESTSDDDSTDESVTSSQSPTLNSRTPDNSIKVWSL
jgi:telomerase Cajal body protein 1